MITWRLWHNLQIPFIEHPLYWRMVKHIRTTANLRFTDIIPIPQIFRFNTNVIAFISGFALVLFVCAGGWIIALPILAAVPFIPLTGMLYGLVLALRIGGLIAREREQGRYELVGVTPYGLAGSNWAICTAIYHHGKSMGQVRDMVRGLYLVMLVVAGLMLFVAFFSLFLNGQISLLSPNLFATLENNALLRNSLVLGFVVGAFYIDFIQSIILGIQIGMFSGNYTANILNARGIATGIYLMIQLIYYAVMALICFVILPALFNTLGLHSVILLSLVQLTVFYAGRECLIYVIWQQIANQIASQTAELNRVVKVPRW